MNSQDRKLQQRVSRRKEKVQRLIREQEARVATLDPSAFTTHQDYFHAAMTVRQRLYRLEQELKSLETGKWSGMWG